MTEGALGRKQSVKENIWLGISSPVVQRKFWAAGNFLFVDIGGERILFSLRNKFQFIGLKNINSG